MASNDDLAVMKQIAQKFDYEKKIDNTVKKYPLITYATVKKSNYGVNYLSRNSNQQHIKAIYLAMKCNIPFNKFDTHIINLCKADDTHDIDNLQKGGYLKDWNGVWILQTHGTAGGVSIDNNTVGATNFYKKYGRYILSQKDYRVGLLKTCFSAKRGDPNKDSMLEPLSFMDVLRRRQNDKEVVLIGATTGTTVSPLYAEHWGLPMIGTSGILNFSKNSGKYEDCFNETPSAILASSDEEDEINIDPFTGRQKSPNFSSLTSKFYENFSLDPNKLTGAEDSKSANLIQDADIEQNQNDDEKKDDLQQDAANIIGNLYPLVDSRIQEQSNQLSIPEAERCLYWYKTGPIIKSKPVINNEGNWNLFYKDSIDKDLYDYKPTAL